jgi:hypothetical protein
MNPIKFEGRNRTFGAPKDWDEEKNGICYGLPAKQDEAGNIISVWQPTPAERARIAKGENIVLSCFTIQPPVILTIAPIYDENSPPKALIIANDDCDIALIQYVADQRAVRQLFAHARKEHPLRALIRVALHSF